jgi:hypothetical protein
VFLGVKGYFAAFGSADLPGGAKQMGVVVSIVASLARQVDGDIDSHAVAVGNVRGKLQRQGLALGGIQLDRQGDFKLPCGLGIFAGLGLFDGGPKLLTVHGLAIWGDDLGVHDAIAPGVVVRKPDALIDQQLAGSICSGGHG